MRRPEDPVRQLSPRVLPGQSRARTPPLTPHQRRAVSLSHFPKGRRTQCHGLFLTSLLYSEVGLLCIVFFRGRRNVYISLWSSACSSTLPSLPRWCNFSSMICECFTSWRQVTSASGQQGIAPSRLWSPQKVFQPLHPGSQKGFPRQQPPPTPSCITFLDSFLTFEF